MRRDPIHGMSPSAGAGQLDSLVSAQEHWKDDAPARSPVGSAPVASAPRLWRIFGTGISFAVFGVSALGLALLVFPLCSIASGDADRGHARVQRLICYAYRAFVKLMEGLGLIRTEWIGADALRTPGPKLIVANHPTLIDIVHLISRLPQADCVIGIDYARSPFLARAASQAGYIPNEQGAAVVDACAERLRAGRTVVLFPEGTRSSALGMQRFRRGAAHIALRAGVPLVPVVISCTPSMLRKGQAWWDVPSRRSQYTITVLDPIELRSTGASDALVARRLTEMLRERLVEGLDRAGRR